MSMLPLRKIAFGAKSLLRIRSSNSVKPALGALGSIGFPKLDEIRYISSVSNLKQAQEGLSSEQVNILAQAIAGYNANGEPEKADTPDDVDEPSNLEAPEEGKDEPVVAEEDFGATMKPRELVDKLDSYIVGQAQAKRAVSIALRNRWRRQQLSSDLRNEVIPKNILMIGPTGCGKTEIARRIARLCNAPFVKVEATKFTEVGFHGRDVDQIIRDLADSSLNMVKGQKRKAARAAAREKAEEEIIKKLTHGKDEREKKTWIQHLKEGSLDHHHVEVEVPQDSGAGAISGGMSPDVQDIMQKMMVFKSGPRNKVRKKMLIKDALPMLEEIELDGMIDETELRRDALQAVEESGIVFIDEIDKICTKPGGYQGADASSEGVQRDLLPLIEGCAISTKYGTVNTDFILFIASGAFHSCKPSDLLAELQGRLPIRVELNPLTEDDLFRILTEPKPNLIRQYVEMMAVEQVNLVFEEEAIREIASVAAEVNRIVENIGARRLQTILERVVEDISFSASDYEPGTTITVTKDMVREHVTDLMVKSDVSKYIL
mmetsp:Transcript_18898/g.24407  ORF Transcript_18898/g.24407 Transcript_18898/m.24407 type:complete len:546 (+) Transcript_18898:141-1778(+)